MPIILTYPFFLIALAILPATVILYMLYRRRKKYVVSCLFLWERISMPREKGRRLNRLIFPLILFIELLILLLLIIAAAEPRVLLQDRSRPLVVILDNSVSMHAVAENKSARERAAEYFSKLLAREKFTSLRFIIAGATYKTRPVFRSHSDAWQDAQNAWTCDESDDSCDTAFAQAFELAGDNGRVLVLTDQPYKNGDILPGARWHSVGTPTGNMAFIAARRTPTEEGDRCLVEISNFSDEERITRAEIYAESVDTGMVHSLTLEAGGTHRLVFTVPHNTGALHVKLPDDALMADNHVILMPAPRKKVQVTNAIAHTATHTIVNDAVHASGMVRTQSDDPIVFFTDTLPPSPTEEETSSVAWYDCTVVCIEPDDPVLFAGPFFIDTSHPLTEGLHLDNVVWGASKKSFPDGIPLVTADEITLLSLIELPDGREQIGLQFTPDATTLHMTPNWPVLIWNILYRIAQRASGPEETTVYAGMTVPVMSNAEMIQCEEPNGETRQRKVVNNRVAFTLNSIGMYTFSDGGHIWHIAANMCAPDESNLRLAKEDTQDTWYSQEAIDKEYKSIAAWFILAALAFLLAHAYLVRRAGGLQ